METLVTTGELVVRDEPGIGDLVKLAAYEQLRRKKDLASYRYGMVLSQHSGMSIVYWFLKNDLVKEYTFCLERLK